MSGMRFEENRITRFTLHTRSCNPCTYFCAAVDDHKDTVTSFRGDFYWCFMLLLGDLFNV